MSELSDRVARVLEGIAAAAARVGRPEGSVILVAVTKTHPASLVRRALEAGLRVIGENRVQEAVAKKAEVDGGEWHLVGHLQRNKARQAVETFSLIHSLDSPALARRLDALGRERGRPVETLVQVNLSGEATKAGVSEEGLPAFLEECSGLEGLRVQGLMTIPAPSADPEAGRPDYVRLRTLLEREAARGRPVLEPRHLSMGMSGDFEVAVEEGATLVRVGTALFGPRPR